MRAPGRASSAADRPRRWRSASRSSTARSSSRKTRSWRSAARHRRSATRPPSIATRSRPSSPRASGAIRRRMDALARLLRPASVAIVGASADPGKLTGRPVAYLQKHGFAGRIYPINPRYDTIAGIPCYPGVTSLPAPPDVGLVLLGADAAIEAVRELAGAGTAAAIVLASGFGETGAEGEAR